MFVVLIMKHSIVASYSCVSIKFNRRNAFSQRTVVHPTVKHITNFFDTLFAANFYVKLYLRINLYMLVLYCIKSQRFSSADQ